MFIRPILLIPKNTLTSNDLAGSTPHGGINMYYAFIPHFLPHHQLSETTIQHYPTLISINFRLKIVKYFHSLHISTLHQIVKLPLIYLYIYLNIIYLNVSSTQFGFNSIHHKCNYNYNH